jgi:hypothetical protein
MDEAITEFRRLKDDTSKSASKSSRHIVARGSSELVKKLDDGWILVQPVTEDRFLLKF